MKQRMLICLAGAATALTIGLFVLAGCGGGGGPILVPGNAAASVSALFLQLLPAAQSSASYVGTAKCQSCHTDQYHSNWKVTRHAQVGTGCEQCHGPGSVHAQNRTASLVKADILTYPNVTEPIVCGQCHGPIFDQLNNSRHAGAVADVIASAHANPAGGKTCLRCHGAPLRTQFINATWTQGKLQNLSETTIQNQADTAITSLTNAQIDAFATASHQSANCVTCHDPHTRTGNLLASGEEKQLRRATFSIDPTPILPGSATKVTSNLNHICGTCHNGRGGDPSDAALLKASSTARPNFHEGPSFNMLLGVTGSLPPGTVIQHSSHADAPDQCVHCHMPDARHTFTVSLDTSCQPCHTAADAAARESSVRDEVLTGLLVLRTRLESWAQTKFANSAFWDYYSLVDEDPAVQAESKAIQDQIPIEIRRVRHNYYFIIRDRSFGIHNTPYTRQLLFYSHSLLDSLGVSRAAVPKSRAQILDVIKRDLWRSIKSDIHEDAT